MKKFISKTSLFATLVISYFLINMIINKYIYSNQALSIRKTNTLIIGDSHTQKSLNPKYFDDAQNLSQTSEPYVISYWKLKHVTKFFIPDTLILGFAPHNISQFNDLKFSNPKWSKEMFRRAYQIEEFDNIKSISVDIPTFYKVLWKETGFLIKKNHTNYIGNYSNRKLNYPLISDCSKAVKRHYYNKEKKLSVSSLSIDYLDSISELCKSKNIELILVSNPVHENYLEEIPQSIMNRYMDLKKRFQNSHIIFDQTKTIYSDSLYLDCDHLNEVGAKKFTTDLINFLK